MDFTRTRPEDLNDPEHKLEYIEKSMDYYNQHMSTVKIMNSIDVDYVMFLIKQAYEKMYK